MIGLLHPGEMGAAVAARLTERGHPVAWASAERGTATRNRAADAGLVDVGTVEELVAGGARTARDTAGHPVDLVFSICPPHAALEVAQRVARAGFRGLFVDANAVSPATARQVGELITAGGGSYVDGGIIGPPPTTTGSTRLYLSGADADTVVALFTDTGVEARVLDEQATTASALKMTYAAWTKGTAALLLAIREVADHEGVDSWLLEEWTRSQPELPDRSAAAEASAASKGWRWVGEIDEIAATFDAAGLPAGFHEACAEIYRRGSARNSRTAQR